MPGNALAERSHRNEQVRFGETELAVLPLDRSFLYLCVHGALDGWFRFKSLADVAALWRSFSAEQRSALADQAHESGILPEMAAALRLAQELELVDADALTAPMQLQTAQPRGAMDPGLCLDPASGAALPAHAGWSGKLAAEAL